MSANKKKLIWNILKTNSGCGCNKLKPSDIIQPKPKPKPKSLIDQKPTSLYNSSSSFSEKGAGDDDENYCTSTTFSLNLDSLSQNCSEHENDPTSTKISGSIAVVKDSDDPYNDFRQSMLQMIIEREIYSKEELQELLNRFLELNDPTQHEIIVEAFMDIWDEVLSKRPFIPGQPCEPQEESRAVSFN